MFICCRKSDVMKLTGYCDPWSAESGQTVEFKVSSTVGDYAAEIVQLIHGDRNPLGPGLKTKSVRNLGAVSAHGEQPLNSGSYVQIDNAAAFNNISDLTLTLWVMPSLQKKTDQCLLSHWHHGEQLGWALVLSPENEIVFRYAGAEGVETLGCGHPLQLNAWYFVAVRIDAVKQSLSLIHNLWSNGCRTRVARRRRRVLMASSKFLPDLYSLARGAIRRLPELRRWRISTGK